MDIWYIYISFSAMNLFHTFPSLRGYVTCGPLPVKPWFSAPDFEALSLGHGHHETHFVWQLI